MYLTRVALDPRRRTTMIALSNPQQFHGAIERSYPGERRRRLWRLDTLRGNLYLLVLSEDPSALEPVSFSPMGRLSKSTSFAMNMPLSSSKVRTKSISLRISFRLASSFFRRAGADKDHLAAGVFFLDETARQHHGRKGH